ncbi:MAG TPA: MoaD/ThiS family protein [Wenzhouxiangella sp.]|nr:MoaD/ThiS family protein [Wenzhouxiangella sp.]
MTIRITLFGALREADSSGELELPLPAGGTVADLRRHLTDYLGKHAPDISPGLVRRSAFATDKTVLRDSDAVPEVDSLAILPPVSGG